MRNHRVSANNILLIGNDGSKQSMSPSVAEKRPEKVSLVTSIWIKPW